MNFGPLSIIEKDVLYGNRTTPLFIKSSRSKSIKIQIALISWNYSDYKNSNYVKITMRKIRHIAEKSLMILQLVILIIRWDICLRPYFWLQSPIETIAFMRLDLMGLHTQVTLLRKKNTDTESTDSVRIGMNR